jgi:hypothetical protein
MRDSASWTRASSSTAQQSRAICKLQFSRCSALFCSRAFRWGEFSSCLQPLWWRQSLQCVVCTTGVESAAGCGICLLEIRHYHLHCIYPNNPELVDVPQARCHYPISLAAASAHSLVKYPNKSLTSTSLLFDFVTRYFEMCHVFRLLVGWVAHAGAAPLFLCSIVQLQACAIQAKELCRRQLWLCELQHAFSVSIFLFLLYCTVSSMDQTAHHQ